MEDAKWDPDIENTVEISDPVLRSGANTFSAAMHAQFGDFVEPLLPTSSTANRVIEKVHQSLAAALEASVRAGELYRSRFVKEILRDFGSLFARSTTLFPEIGPPIDTTSTGPLGDLWRGTLPPRTSPIDHVNSKPEPLFPANGQGKEELDPNRPNTTAGDASPNGLSSTHGTEPALPEEGYLYKYVSFETLLKVLKNKTLRFSRVSGFNDPFDGQLLPIRKFGWKKFFGALRDETTRLVTTKDESIYQLPDDIPTDAALSAAAQQITELLKLSDKRIAISPTRCDEPAKVEPLFKLLRSMIYLAQQGCLGSNEEALACLNGLLDIFQNHRVSFSLQDVDRRIIAALADAIHVLCLSEVPESLLMWSHYADHHTGAVLKFDTCSETADYFATARPVIYENELPSVEQPRSLVRHYLGLPLETDRWISRQFFTKSAEWAYEKEWRVIAPTAMGEHGEFVPFQAGSFVAIYLGCRVTTPMVHSVLDLVIGEQYPTDVYVAVKDEAEFAINFVPVSNGKTRTSNKPNLDINERGRLYRWCLDAYFDFWNELGDDLHGELRRLRSEGVLADYGPSNSKELFREMIQKLQETFAAKPTISADKEKEPEEHMKQHLRILQPSARAYGALEDALKDDLAARGGTLPERKEPPELNSD